MTSNKGNSNNDGEGKEGQQEDSVMQSLEKGQLTSSQELKNVFQDTFPNDQLQKEIVYAFGYGSGVFAQTTTTPDHHQSLAAKVDDEQQKTGDTTPMAKDKEKKMLDMLLIVRDALRFHTLNSLVNPNHYAGLFRNHPSRATWWQKHDLNNTLSFFKNPKIFFNFVDEEAIQPMKYGIIEVSDLSSDLQNWDSLYIAGRMHKPTATIFQQQDDDYGQQQQLESDQMNHNLPAALATSLLLLSSSSSLSSSATSDDDYTIPLSELYSQISSLSYTGDFRMQMGAEDPGKINKLVYSPGQIQRFHHMYYETALRPLAECGLLSFKDHHHSNDDDDDMMIMKTKISWNPKDPSSISHLRQQLPKRLQQRVVLGVPPPDPAAAAPFDDVTARSTTSTTTTTSMMIQGLQQELHSIVAPAARYQSFKGLWTAGLVKSASYAFAKLSKGILRR